MKLVRLAYLDTNAVFEREVIRVEIQTIVSPVLEEVGLKARLSGSHKVVYLFHGTGKQNIDSIAKKGFLVLF